jgi:S-DNA-T family DNA segregation ATPase FtsK/SpoIIIE
MPSRRSKRKPPQRGLSITLDKELQREILGVLLIAVGSVTGLSLLSITRGTLSESWVRFLRRICGWGVYLLTLALVGGGLLLLWEDLRKRLSIPARRIVGLEVLVLASLGLSHLTVAPEESYALAARGGGGGYIGWAISYFLVLAAGQAVSVVALALAALLGLIVFADLDWSEVRLLLFRLRARLADIAPPPEAEAREPPASMERESQTEPAATTTKPRAAKEPRLVRARPARRRLKRFSRGLPPLDLLNGGDQRPIGDADVRYKKQVIEETLASFGVPAEVVEVNLGPTITQFGVEPGFMEYRRADGTVRRRKVKVSKIMSLQDDLALALAAAPIRIEAPVPGRSVVGIEVPNDTPSLVGLREVVESEAFRSLGSKLRVALGQDVSGRPVAGDLALMPHLLIAGATGSGKSVCINSITACLLLNNAPDTLSLLMVDPKMVELSLFNGIPHLAAPVVTSAEEAVRALRWVTKQMDHRYQLFSSSGVRDIGSYNELAASRRQDPLPFIVILIDELADLMMVAPDEIERHVCRIAQLARATGIHLVIATQRPSVDVVTGLIKANFPARISFAVTSQVDSRVILDTAGAEKLLGRGDLLYMASDSNKLVRMQGCFVSDEELERIVQFWREKIDWIVPEHQPAPWQELPAEEEVDELLERAINLARGSSTISTSYIQRRLRIGHPRAARLIEQMELRGIVGPAVNGGRSREVLIDQDYVADIGGAGEPRGQ